MSPRGRSPHFPHCVPSKWSQVPCSLEKPGQPQTHPTLPTAANPPAPGRRIVFPVLLSSAETGKLSKNC